jgi:hypothetical protein
MKFGGQAFGAAFGVVYAQFFYVSDHQLRSRRLAFLRPETPSLRIGSPLSHYRVPENPEFPSDHSYKDCPGKKDHTSVVYFGNPKTAQFLIWKIVQYKTARWFVCLFICFSFVRSTSNSRMRCSWLKFCGKISLRPAGVR